MPYAYSYSGQVECTFIADKFLRQRAFFENWQNKVFDEDTHHINYYDNFVGQMDIYQLETELHMVLDFTRSIQN